MTTSLTSLDSGTCQDSAITRISKEVSCFTVFRSRITTNRHRVCTLNASTFSSTIKVFDVSGSNRAFTLVFATEFSVLFGAYSVPIFLRAGTELVVAVKESYSVAGGFEVVDLTTLGRRTLLQVRHMIPSHLEFSLEKPKPLTVLRVGTSSVFIACYDKLAFYINSGGEMTRNALMRWTQPASAFVHAWKYGASKRAGLSKQLKALIAFLIPQVQLGKSSLYRFRQAMSWKLFFVSKQF
ncbi:hypothetical protein K438DRAFT_1925909 [Mycena galopus ATCC 62051]|nr:hypothetical protein K438DRAFT_1925909 [Mycena galopus ATCC 62051]